MGRKLPPLNALKAFEAAARHLSFNKAAQELCVTQGAVSRQIQVLEKHLGTPLFRRMSRSVEMTEQGRLLFPSVHYALDELEKAARRIKGADRAKILTISTSPTFALKWLYPRLFRFSEQEPDIEIRTITTAEAVDFSRDDIDVALRIGRFDPTDNVTGPRINYTSIGEPRGIKVARLMDDKPIPVCSPGFLDRHGPFHSLADFEEDMLIHMASRLDEWHEWYSAEGLQPPINRKHVYGHFYLGVEAALRGLGIALVPHVHVQDDIAAGLLVVPLKCETTTKGAYYFLSRSRQWSVPKIAAFRRWIVAESNSWVAERSTVTGFVPQVAAHQLRAERKAVSG
jgi:LysR family transcriptional regulator, glycine cleavage system transcriptional activator